MDHIRQFGQTFRRRASVRPEIERVDSRPTQNPRARIPRRPPPTEPRPEIVQQDPAVSVPAQRQNSQDEPGDPLEPHRRAWLDTIEEVRVVESLLSGNEFPEEAKSHLEAGTRRYLANLPAQTPLRRVEVLLPLIRWYTDQGGDLLTATLSCLEALGYDGARSLITALHDIDESIYLRFLCLVGQLYPEIIRNDEARMARTLLELHCLKPGEFSLFQEYYTDIDEGLISGCVLLPPALLSRILRAIGIAPVVCCHLDNLVEAGQLKRAFDNITWLKGRPSVWSNDVFTHKGNPAIPALEKYACWKPDRDRIALWEETTALTESERCLLSPLFALEGPDTTGRNSETLKATSGGASPANAGEEVVTTDWLLQKLDASIKCGPSAVNIFIHNCVKNTPDNISRLVVERATEQDDEGCKALVSLKVLTDRTDNLSKRVMAGPAVLYRFESWGPHTNDYITELALVVTGVYVAAREDVFTRSANPRTGGGSEAAGERLWQLGKAIAASAWLHEFISAELLAEIGRLPDEKTFQALILSFQATDRGMGQTRGHDELACCRRETWQYFLISLGLDVPLDRHLRQRINDEIEFWKQPPLVSTQQFARALYRLPLTYGVYVDCLQAAHGVSKDRNIFGSLLSFIRNPQPASVLKLVEYLAETGGSSSFTDCWFTMTACLVNHFGQKILDFMKTTMPAAEWLRIIQCTTSVFRILSRHLNLTTGLRPDDVHWWSFILQKYRDLLEHLSTVWEGSNGAQASWIYLRPDANTREFLDVFRDERTLALHQWRLLDHLRPDGINRTAILGCHGLYLEQECTARSILVAQRLFSRVTTKSPAWDSGALGSFMAQILDPNSPEWTDFERRLVTKLAAIVQVQPRSNPYSLTKVSRWLADELDTLMEETRELEKKRKEMERSWPTEVQTKLCDSGINANRGSRGALRLDDMSEDMIDAVEDLGNDEYRMLFDLTKFNDLQRQGLGLRPSETLLAIKVKVRDNPRFCIHFGLHCLNCDEVYPGLGGLSRSRLRVCVGASGQSLFSFALSKRLSALLGSRRGASSQTELLKDLFKATEEFISTPASHCLDCNSPFSAYLIGFSSGLMCHNAPSCPDQVKLHRLLQDEVALDLLLTSLHQACRDLSVPTLFPGVHPQIPNWPNERREVAKVLDALPVISSLDPSRCSGRGKTTRFFKHLNSSFRSLLIQAPRQLHINAMPGTRQFILVNASPEKQHDFETISNRTAGRLVFHGTRPSALFSILSEGLQMMTNNNHIVNGAYYGNGIYLAEEPRTSVDFARANTSTWPNSSFAGDANTRVLLVCELAGNVVAPLQGIHVITDPRTVMVRYVFLLPANFQAPARANIEQAFLSAFAQLRRSS